MKSVLERRERNDKFFGLKKNDFLEIWWRIEQYFLYKRQNDGDYELEN